MGEVFARAARAAWGHFLPPGRLAGFAMSPGRLAGAVSAAAQGSIALVAEDDAGVVGFVVGGPAVDGDVDPRRVGLIDLLYVTPARWGEGAGRSLMRAALVRMASSGMSEAVLWTARDNDPPARGLCPLRLATRRGGATAGRPGRVDHRGSISDRDAGSGCVERAFVIAL